MSATLIPLDLRKRLNQEWAQQFGHRICTFGILGDHTPEDLLQQIKGAEGTEQDRLLHALLTQSQNGNKDAERVLLQSLLPAVVRMSRTVRALTNFTDSDKISYAVGEAWGVITSYPLRCSTKVHANLTMRLLQRLAETNANQRLIHDKTITTTDENLDYLVGAAPERAATPEARLAHLFTWAMEAGVIDRAEIALLSRVALGDESTTEIADDLEVSVKCLRKRVERIRAKLSGAVRTEIVEAA